MPEVPVWARSKVQELFDEGFGSEDIHVDTGLSLETVREIIREIRKERDTCRE